MTASIPPRSGPVPGEFNGQVPAHIHQIQVAADELRALIANGGQLRKQEVLEDAAASSIVAEAALVRLVDAGEISLFRVGNVTKIRREHR